MKSWDVVEHGAPLQARFHATPKPKGTEVLVRVLRSGVCHSDLHVQDGYFDLGGGKRFRMSDRGVVPPFTMGHEPFGVVEALGPRAKGVRVGARRIVYPWIGCGKCGACRAGQDNYCLSARFLGILRPGAYATHVLVPDPKYLVDARGVDESFAATLACSGLTAYSALDKLAAPGPKDWFAVLGCGGLGLVAISLLRARGMRRIIACDVDPAKLEVARRLGAKAVLDTRGEGAGAALAALAGGNLAGVVDFVGTPATAQLGIGALRKGGRFVLVGLFGGEITLSLPPIAQRAIAVMGSYVGSLAELKAVVALARSGRLKPGPVATRGEDALNDTLAEMRAGRLIGRVAIDFERVSSTSEGALTAA